MSLLSANFSRVDCARMSTFVLNTRYYVSWIALMWLVSLHEKSAYLLIHSYRHIHIGVRCAPNGCFCIRMQHHIDVQWRNDHLLSNDTEFTTICIESIYKSFLMRQHHHQFTFIVRVNRITSFA